MSWRMQRLPNVPFGRSAVRFGSDSHRSDISSWRRIRFNWESYLFSESCVTSYKSRDSANSPSGNFGRRSGFSSCQSVTCACHSRFFNWPSDISSWKRVTSTCHSRFCNRHSRFFHSQSDISCLESATANRTGVFFRCK